MYKDLVLDNLVGCSHLSKELRLAVDRYAPGDRRDQQKFVFMTSEAMPQAEVLEYLKKDSLPFVRGHSPFIRSRPRRTGVERSLQDVGLLGCIHNLLEASYNEFMVLQFGAKASGANPPVASSSGGLLALQDMERGDDADDPSRRHDSSGVARAGASRACRRKASAWTRTMPWGDVLLMRIALAPMQRYLCGELEMSSGEWDTVQWI